MEDDYNDSQDSVIDCGIIRSNECESGDVGKEYLESAGDYEEVYDEEGNGGQGSFTRGGRGTRGNFRGRGRGPPPTWMNGPPPGCPPMRFRGRGYGPGGPPMRGRGFFPRGRGGPRFGPGGNGPPNGPNFEGNWGPMGPPPPGMMGGPPPPFGPPPGIMGPGGPMGPPPNMMGQGPPYSGPPGMPPPNMQPQPDLWVETKSDDGKSYYYHARTRETTWIRPQETATCKVITQAEMEAIAASGQIPPGMVGSQTIAPMGPMPGMMPNGMLPSNMPTNVSGANSGAPGSMPPFMGQPPPWMSKSDGNKTPIQDSTSPSDQGDDAPPGESAPLTSSSGVETFSGPPHGFPNPALNSGGPGFGGPWNAGAPWTAPPGWPPPILSAAQMNQPPPNVAAVAATGGAASLPPVAAAVVSKSPGQVSIAARSEQSSAAAEPVKAKLQIIEDVHLGITIPPDLMARAAEWTTHRAPDGRPYYYHAKKQESVWKKPQPLKQIEALQIQITADSSPDDDQANEPEKMEVDDTKTEVIDVEAHAEAAAEAAAAAEREAAERAATEERERQERERLEKEKAEKEKMEKEKADKEKAKQDKSRPISSTPISGTPWCVVWTGDGRVFFYNPTAHSSVWERPEQLIGRADVDKAVSQPPEALLELQRREAAASGAVSTPVVAKKAPSNGDLKRAAEDSDSDDSDSEPIKKPKLDDTKKISTGGGGVIDAGKEAAIEAEVRAARERAIVPFEQRFNSFRQLLHEKEVSAFSTWEKELHKIVFDSRYLLLTSKERKQVFEKYVRERAEEERKEKKNRLQQKKNAFKQLMEEAKLHTKSSYTEFAAKYNKEERFKNIEKVRDREIYFNEYITEVRKREKEEKEKKKEQVKIDFIALLREKNVDRHLRWSEAKKKIDTDPRYKAVESSTLKEDYYREYCKLIKEEKKKDKDAKDKERESRSSGKKEKKDKDREKDKEKKEKKDKTEKPKEKGSDESDGVAASVPVEEQEDGENAASDEETAAKERAARVEASLKEREKEVQRALATSLRDRDKEREYHKRDEAVQHFNALLADLVRNADLTWREAKKQLKKDHRFSLAELLGKEDKERLFTQHTTLLAGKRRDKFRDLLAELSIEPTAHWRDVRKLLKDEPRTPKYASMDKMEREFRDYQRDKQNAAKTALRQLLQETRSITYKTLATVKDNSSSMQQVQDGLKHDARFLALEHIPDEREQIIMSYLEELDKKGPPPPPTATEPTRRSKQ